MTLSRTKFHPNYRPGAIGQYANSMWVVVGRELEREIVPISLNVRTKILNSKYALHNFLCQVLKLLIYVFC